LKKTSSISTEEIFLDILNSQFDIINKVTGMITDIIHEIDDAIRQEKMDKVFGKRVMKDIEATMAQCEKAQTDTLGRLNKMVAEKNKI